MKIIPYVIAFISIAIRLWQISPCSTAAKAVKYLMMLTKMVSVWHLFGKNIDNRYRHTHKRARDNRLPERLHHQRHHNYETSDSLSVFYTSCVIRYSLNCARIDPQNSLSNVANFQNWPQNTHSAFL